MPELRIAILNRLLPAIISFDYSSAPPLNSNFTTSLVLKSELVKQTQDKGAL
jgi:hypothetical protein